MVVTAFKLFGQKLAAVVVTLALVPSSPAIDLLQRYPTQLSEGDSSPNHARPWEFTRTDLFELSRFELRIAELKIQTGPADLGIGHSADGAVWAIVLPRAAGKLRSQATDREESIAHVWLRFHPKQITGLFPVETVIGMASPELESQMRVIANSKFTSSWHVGWNAMIPAPKDLTVDVDTQTGPRRFFIVDQESQKAEYVAAFENRKVRLPAAFSVTLAEKAFDQLWEAFDREYAMFVLRPEVDWDKLRLQYRPLALKAKSVYEFAGVCAELLKPLRDLHIWLKVAGADVPVFNRPRFANANPAATANLVGELNDSGSGVQWTVTADRIGYLAIHNWSNPEIVGACHQALEEMRDTRGLVVDVRLNGGGSEDLAQEVAGRFLTNEFVYAYSQFRNGTSHTNLTERFERKVGLQGPWRYNRPVVLLIGQKCMSSNESFVAMMSGDPDLTTMGDHTCGSSGNPRMLQLPMDITVSIPRWIDYLPDGTPLDERGFQPQVLFKAKTSSFESDRDELLAAALDRLLKAPLPEHPISGPQFGQ